MCPDLGCGRWMARGSGAALSGAIPLSGGLTGPLGMAVSRRCGRPRAVSPCLAAGSHPVLATQVPPWLASPSTARRARVNAAASRATSAGDLDLAADRGSPSAVPAAHQVADFALDLGPGRPVAGLPARAGLAGAGPWELLLIRPCRSSPRPTRPSGTRGIGLLR